MIVQLSKLMSVLILMAGAYAAAAESTDLAKTGVVVRIAELEIDPKQMEAYKAAVKIGMAEAVKVEPGVISIYAVAIKDKPNHLRFFEVYASEKAYESHIASPHFRKYVEETKSMITSRKLIETTPLQLSTKRQLGNQGYINQSHLETLNVVQAQNLNK